MLTKLFRTFFKDRKGAAALIVAVSLVPIMVASITAVDMARIAAARTVLQAAVDSAATAGAGAFGTSQLPATAIAAAQSAYAGGTATLGGMTLSLTPSTASTLATAYCLPGTGVTCPTGAGKDGTGNCPSSYRFCVVVQAQLTLSNLLLKWITPTSLLGATGVGTAGVASVTVNAGNFTSTSVGSASDINNILAYIVPSTTSGSADLSAGVPAANSSCTSANAGILIGWTPPTSSSSSSSSSSTGCNYVFIGSSLGGSSSGTISFTSGQYIAFAFANLTGAHNQYGADTTHLYYDGIVSETISGGTLKYVSSVPDVSYSGTGTGCIYYDKNTGAWTATQASSPGNCTTSTSTTVGNKTTITTTTYGTPIYGYCPKYNLYGSVSEQADGTYITTNNANASDSETVYSSVYEMLGYPPTHGVNHVMPPFTTTSKQSVTSNGKTTTVSVVIYCPHWPVLQSDALVSGYATKNSSTGVVSGLVPSDTNITANPVTGTGYSTYYPDTTYTGGSGTVYPPNLQSACSPAASYPASGNAVVSSSWWGWLKDNTSSCGKQPTKSTGSLTTYDPSYNNCMLIIQPLGVSQASGVSSTYNVPSSSGTPVMPNYYVEIKDTTGKMVLFDPVYNNASSYTDYNPGVIAALIMQYQTSSITTKTGTVYVSSTLGLQLNADGTVTSTNSSGYLPSKTYTATLGTTATMNNGTSLNGYTATISTPSQTGITGSLPPDTSSRCYNPQQNGYSSSSFSSAGNNKGAAIDYVANPQFGALDCTSYSGNSFALYWNDGGSSGGDDLGYWNAVTLFTCPTPTYSTGVLAPATLSG